MEDVISYLIAADPKIMTTMRMIGVVAAATLLTIICTLIFFVIKRSRELSSFKQRFAPVVELDVEVARMTSERENVASDIDRVRNLYLEKKAIYDQLHKQVAIFDEQISFAEFGVYEPHFEFGDSERYKEEIKVIRGEQKKLVKMKEAVLVGTQFVVDNSISKGKTMTNRAVRLALRAFNAEADAAIANTRWNNAESMLKRIENARIQIDKANTSLSISISNRYLDAKIKELRLAHEYREQLKVEREKRSEEARLKREEKRLEREADEARREEEKYEALLAKARAEAGVKTTEEHAAKIAELERQLSEAHEKTERAKAMAERTKSGFVYIISNIGSFGQNVIKIGLTRRLDPIDRVRELGDASVPFLFDTHAMIYSDDAPALEAALHAEFNNRRINAANMRKEFFKVSLDEVKDATRRLAPDAEFHMDIEAQEFRETMAKRKEQLETESQANELTFPKEI